MKHFKIYSLFSFLTLGLLGSHCNEKNKNIDAISILFDYGDGSDFIFIGDDENRIDSAFINDTNLKVYLPFWYSTPDMFYHYNGPKKCVLTPESFEYISKYISKHCAQRDINEKKTISKFTIRLYSRKGDEVCTFYYNDKLIKYFKNMIQHMDKSPYATDYQILKEEIYQYINNYKYYNK